MFTGSVPKRTAALIGESRGAKRIGYFRNAVADQQRGLQSQSQTLRQSARFNLGGGRRQLFLQPIGEGIEPPVGAARQADLVTDAGQPRPALS